MRILKPLSPPSSSSAPNSYYQTTAIFHTITLHSNNHSLILDTIKRGEDDEDVSTGELPKRKGRSVVVRVYESLGGMSRGVLRLENKEGIKAKKVFKVNILEDDLEECSVREREGAQEVGIELRGFEVATFRFQL